MAAIQPPEYLQKHIEIFLKNKHLSNLKCHFSNACKDGENYLGSVYRVKIKGEKNGENEELNLVIKSDPEFNEIAFLIKATDLFINEIFFYEEILPLFTNLLKEFNLRYEDFPEYYGGCKTPKNESILLEDLKYKGFVMKDTKLLDYSHAVLAARQLGRFHAYSFALRDKKPAEFETVKKIKEQFFIKSGMYEKQLKAVMESAMMAVENEGEHYVEKIKQLSKNAQKHLDYACDSRNAEPYAILNHGDVWTCNMLFKYNENSDPEDIRFLDFQLCRYGSPAMDIYFMFFTCLTQETRDKYYDELLHHYHDSLSQVLEKLNCDVEKLFPFKVLLEHLQRFGGYGACICSSEIHVITAQEGDGAQPLFNLDFFKALPITLLKSNKHYYHMIRDLLKDMVDRNYI